MLVKRSIVTVPPAVEPIDRDDIGKLALKLEAGTTEDLLLNIWIQAAREKIEERTGLSLITQTRVMKLDYFPRCGHIELLYGPVQTVVVTYQDEDDTTQTLSSSDYWLDTHGPGTITIKNSWPSTKDRPAAVTITYVAGYGSGATSVPAALKSAVLMRFAHLYENRQSVAPGAMETVPLGEDDLIFPYVMTQDASY
jgi:uncharacterized phiE125 gp8 family phage protein